MTDDRMTPEYKISHAYIHAHRYANVFGISAVIVSSVIGFKWATCVVYN